jgi:hypothetical protein
MAENDELPVTGPIEKDDEYSGPSIPVIGLQDFPKLPTTELAIAEQKFVAEGFADYVEPSPSAAELREQVGAALEKFDARTTWEQAAISAVSKLGLLALRPAAFELRAPFGPPDLLRDCETLRSRVWKMVERWRNRVETSADLEVRQAATRNLRSFADQLVPDGRGKRRAAAEPRVIVLAYHILLFRLRHARSELEAASDWSPTTVEQIAGQSGLHLEHLRTWLFLTDSWVRRSGSLTAEQMARQMVAEMAGISPEAVANIMSRTKRRPEDRADSGTKSEADSG